MGAEQRSLARLWGAGAKRASADPADGAKQTVISAMKELERREAEEDAGLDRKKKKKAQTRGKARPKEVGKRGQALPEMPEGYAGFLADLKGRISAARVKAALAVNAELITLYWSIGRDIITRQEREGWGSKVLERLSDDLRRAFPDMKGLSVRNLKYMRDLALAWPKGSIGQQLVAQIPWGHNIRLLQKVKDSKEREWYARACIEHGWSRNVLEMQIETGLYHRQGGAATNFARTLPAPQSYLAREALKDPYNFEFLTIAEAA